jgi:hypothetical protein
MVQENAGANNTTENKNQIKKGSTEEKGGEQGIT